MKTMQAPDLHTTIQRISAYYDAVDDSTHMEGGNFRVNDKAVRQMEQLFAPDAIYERVGIEDGCFKGSENISRFFRGKRSLIGEHTVKEANISVETGVSQELAGAFNRYFPELDQAACVTVKAHGLFKGARCFTDKNRFVTGVSAKPLSFDDSWVFYQGKVQYRHSVIHTPELELTGVGR